MAYNWQTGGLQGGQTAKTLQAPVRNISAPTSGLQVQGVTNANQRLQPTTAPAYNQSLPAGGGAVAGASTGATGAVTGAVLSAEQVAAQQRQAQANAMKGGIKGMVNSILGVYDAMYGDVNVAAADKVNQVQGVFKEDSDALTQQFGEEFPTIGRAYSARGTGSSGYRFDAEQAAQQGFERTLQSRARVRDEDLGKVGATVAGQQANIQAERGLTANLMAQIDASQDPNELRQVQNALNEKMANLGAQRAGLQSRASYMNTLNAAVPGGSQLPGLRASLTNVINSQVPNQVKSQIGAQLIQNSGLPPSQIDALLGEFGSQINTADDKQLAVA